MVSTSFRGLVDGSAPVTACRRVRVPSVLLSGRRGGGLYAAEDAHVGVVPLVDAPAGLRWGGVRDVAELAQRVLDGVDVGGCADDPDLRVVDRAGDCHVRPPGGSAGTEWG